jgi:hypothetical protein
MPITSGQQDEDHVSIVTTPLRWRRGDTVRWMGTSMRLEVFPGLFWDGGDGLGMYFAKDGTQYECSQNEAEALAQQERVILSYRNRYAYDRR